MVIDGLVVLAAQKEQVVGAVDVTGEGGVVTRTARLLGSNVGDLGDHRLGAPLFEDEGFVAIGPSAGTCLSEESLDRWQAVTAIRHDCTDPSMSSNRGRVVMEHPTVAHLAP